MRHIDKILFIIILGLVASCSMKNNDEHIERKKEEIGLVVTNYTDEYNYFIFLNNEPVYFDNGRAIFNWKGYPLLSGKNEMKLLFHKLPDEFYNMDEFSDITTIRMNVAVTKNSKVLTQEYVDGRLLNGEKKEKLFAFRIESMTNTKVEYIPLAKHSTKEVRREIKKLTLEFVRLLKKRDFVKISKLLKIPNNTDITSKYPKWFLESQDSTLDVCSVTMNDDVELVIGNKMVLVKPSGKFKCSDTTKKLLYMRHREHKASFSITSIMFALKKDGWGVFGQDGAFYLVRKGRLSS